VGGHRNLYRWKLLSRDWLSRKVSGRYWFGSPERRIRRRRAGLINRDVLMSCAAGSHIELNSVCRSWRVARAACAVGWRLAAGQLVGREACGRSSDGRPAALPAASVPAEVDGRVELCGGVRTPLVVPSLPDAADAELLAMAGSQPEAFGELFTRHSQSVYAYCARRTGDLDRAEDLTSVVFLEAFRRRRRKLKLSNTSALPWLLGVANNVVRNSDRSLRRYRSALGRIPDQAISASAEDEAIERLVAQEALSRALDAVSVLTRAEQDVVHLVLWSELTYADAATALGIPIGTVRSRLAGARAKLNHSAPATNNPSAEETL
jgi:RNA polymerase sigma-70 factor (ECF subfamily)